MVDDLYAQHRLIIEQVIHRVSLHFGFQRADRDDFAQDTRVHLIERGLAPFVGRRSIAAYLSRTVSNFAIDWIEARGRRRWLSNRRIAAMSLADVLPDTLPGSIETPEQLLIRAEAARADRYRLALLMAALKCLTPFDRRLFVLKFVRGVDVPTIAAQYRLSRRAAYLRIYRIRDRLRCEIARIEHRLGEEGRKEGTLPPSSMSRPRQQDHHRPGKNGAGCRRRSESS